MKISETKLFERGLTSFNSITMYEDKKSSSEVGRILIKDVATIVEVSDGEARILTNKGKIGWVPIKWLQAV